MNRLGVSNVVVSVVLVALGIFAVSVVWISANRIIVNYAPDVECSDFELGVNIEIGKVCYLNNDEILVSIRRNLNAFGIDSLVFSFDSARFELKDKTFGCSDVKEEDSDYGRECGVVGLGQTKNYVFDMTGEDIVEKVDVGIYLVGNEERLCGVGGREVKEKC